MLYVLCVFPCFLQVTNPNNDSTLSLSFTSNNSFVLEEDDITELVKDLEIETINRDVFDLY